MKPVIIDFLRHGEVAAQGWAFRGRTDLPLSEEGWRQMRRVSESFGPLDQIAASPLQRCRHFAEEVSAARNCTLTLLDDMREMDFGAWENRGFDELEAEHGPLLRRFWDSPVGIAPPGGELFDDFVLRVRTCWDHWVAEDCGGHRLLVAHGGVIRVLLASIMDMPMHALWRLHLPYASWSRVSLLKGHQPKLIFLNRER